MKIAFDYQTFSLQSYGGISRYFVRLTEQLLAIRQKVGIFAPLHRNHYVGELPEGIVRGRRLDRYPPKTARFFLAYNQFVAKSAIRTWQPQVVHETYYARLRSGPRSCPAVITVYDMIHELYTAEFPARDNTTQLKRIAIDRADHVICISESTRRDLIRLFGTPEDKVSVVHLGFDHFVCPEAARDTNAPFLGRPYLLYVGNRAGYKNFSNFLKSVASSVHLKTDFDIIAFGGSPFSALEQRLISGLGFRHDQVRQLGGNDTVLGELYDQARAFVYPSLYEGFGLPPLEAMAHRCPVVSSNTSSMPEVIGGAGEFFHPSEIEDMARAIESVVYSDERIEELVTMGLDRLNHFSWQKCADQTLSIYQILQG